MDEIVGAGLPRPPSNARNGCSPAHYHPFPLSALIFIAPLELRSLSKNVPISACVLCGSTLHFTHHRAFYPYM